MKITRRQLRQIIQETLDKESLNERTTADEAASQAQIADTIGDPVYAAIYDMEIPDFLVDVEPLYKAINYAIQQPFAPREGIDKLQKMNSELLAVKESMSKIDAVHGMINDAIEKIKDYYREQKFEGPGLPPL